MATTPVQGPAVQTPTTPGTAVTAIDPNQSGGYIVNPATNTDQGIPTAEVLYVSQVGLAATHANGTTIALQPGQSYTVIPLTTTPVTVASNTPNHKFTAVEWP
jgi:hypothetical protein